MVGEKPMERSGGRISLAATKNYALKFDTTRFDFTGGILGGPFKTKTVALAEVLFCRLGVLQRGKWQHLWNSSQRRLSGHC